MSKKALTPTQEMDAECGLIPVLEQNKLEAAPLSPKAYLEQLQEEETKMVKGIFRNYESPGTYEFVHFKKFPKVPAFSKRMMDGATYEIPLYVARYLQGYDKVAPEGSRKLNFCAYPVGQAVQTREGHAALDPESPEKSQRWVRRIGFETELLD